MSYIFIHFSTLQPATLSRACQYKDSSGKYHEAQWVPSKVEDIQYKPSYNMGPRSVLPILISGSHINSNDDRIICPMLWGMIPPWHQVCSTFAIQYICIIFYLFV